MTRRGVSSRHMSKLERAGGVLLHPTSLPGPFGIGDIGPTARRFVEQLSRAGVSWWQTLPTVPTGPGDSPYQSPSALAGCPELISPELLVDDGLAERADSDACRLAGGPVDYDEVRPLKRALLDRAHERFRAGAAAGLARQYRKWCVAQSDWLEDFALFRVLGEVHEGAPWTEWPEQWARRDPDALAQASAQHPEAIDRVRFEQFLFDRQWTRLRKTARRAGVRFIGDIPLYVSADSADVWSHPELFQLDGRGRPAFVAGVPPDVFCAEGQLWGNPVYEWEAHRRDGFAWWRRRLRSALSRADLVRLDHFRGFDTYWAVPAGDDTAQFGVWRSAPSGDLLAALRDGLGSLPVIVEDLGLITPEVHALRRRFKVPGMRVMQFGFGSLGEALHRPHRLPRNCVAYTGTHDNDTAAGWFAALEPEHRERFLEFAPDAESQPVDALIRMAWSSPANLAIAPMQDLLRLGTEHRMNVPGTPAGNWRWRLTDEQLDDAEWVGRLGRWTTIYDRRR